MLFLDGRLEETFPERVIFFLDTLRILAEFGFKGDTDAVDLLDEMGELVLPVEDHFEFLLDVVVEMGYLLQNLGEDSGFGVVDYHHFFLG